MTIEILAVAPPRAEAHDLGRVSIEQASKGVPEGIEWWNDRSMNSRIAAALIIGLSICSSVADTRSEPRPTRPSEATARAVFPFKSSMGPVPSSVGVVEYVPTKGQATDAELTKAEIKALGEAASIVNAVKNSDCFGGFMTGRKLIEANGQTSDQVTAHLQALRGTVRVAFYYRCNTLSHVCPAPTSAVAYRQPPEEKIFINRAYFDVARQGFDPYELAGTLAHESIGHLLGGYGHSFEWTPNRDFSVPYSISGASRANGDSFQHCRKTLGY
jgi:hypothetical protein